LPKKRDTYYKGEIAQAIVKISLLSAYYAGDEPAEFSANKVEPSLHD